MKKYAIFSIIILIAIVSACSPKLRFDQTCMTCIKSQRLACKDGNCPETFITDNNCIVTLIETGENIFLNPILEKEGITPKAGIPVSIAKMNGKIYLTADNFKKLWILKPQIDNEAKYASIALPEFFVMKPVFDFSDKKLRLVADNFGKKMYLLIDDDNWQLFNEPKAGE